MKEEHKTIEGHRIVKNEKGETEFITKYLRETPKQEIDRMNSLYTEWKTCKQVKYDKQGMRIKE